MSNPLEFQVISESWEANGFPDFAPPEVVGYYSLNGDKEFSSDLSQLKYYHSPPKLSEFDLNHGFDVDHRRFPLGDTEKFNHILECILANSSKIRAPADEERWISPHFVCSRSLLKLLFVTPFKTADGWIICACKWRGTIYLYAYETVEKKREKVTLTEQELKFKAWGYKFEQYMLSESPDKPPNIQEPMNEGSFRCVFRSRLGENSLLYAAEIDGVASNKKLTDPVDWNEQQLVELKTSAVQNTDWKKNIFYRHKLLDWWSQSFLVDIEQVHCGFRDGWGMVEQLSKISVATMPEVAPEGSWNKAGCGNFCDKFLDWVKSVVVKDYKESVYKFEYHPIIKRETVYYPRGKILAQELNGDSEYSFLPQWFIDRAERSEHE